MARHDVPGKTQADQTNGQPDIYGYLDYRAFLKDWLARKRAGQSPLSLTTIARKAGVTVAFLSMVLSGKRKLTPKALSKLVPQLGCSRAEISYLKHLITFADSEIHEEKLESLRQLRRYSSYRRKNPEEIAVHQYFTRWFYAAIRELANLPDFRADAKWIQGRLRINVETAEIQRALDFLTSHGFFTQEGGKLVPKERDFECVAPVFRVAMAQFHFEMFSLAAASIENTPREERNILGHTFSIRQDAIPEAKKILDEALAKLRTLEQTQDKGDSIYHAQLALFPLTKGNQS